MSIQQDAIRETVEDVQKLVENTVRKFCRQYKWNRLEDSISELGSDANLLVMEAYYKHDPRRQSFKAYVRYYIWKQLLEKLRRQMEEKRLEQNYFHRHARGTIQKPPEVFDMDELMAKLSDDGCKAVRMAFNMEREQEKEGPKLGSMRVRLKQWLVNLGWSLDRVLETFEEIRRVL